MKQCITYCHGKSVDYIGAQLRTLKCKQLLVVHGKYSFSASGAQAMIEALTKCVPDITLHFFSDFEANPTCKQAAHAALRLQKQQIDAMVAIGGGSALDVAKAALAFASEPQQALAILQCHQKMQPLKIPFMAIPTTAGSGSEATHFAVIYHQAKKYSLSHPALQPDFVFLDGDLTRSTDHTVASAAALDVVCQSIESLWSKAATAESQNYAKQALTLCHQHLTDAVVHRQHSAQDRLLEAAYLAGAAINISKTTAPHAFSYHLTQHYHVKHGHAVALCLPHILRASSWDDRPTNFESALQLIAQALEITPSINDLIQYVENLYTVFSLDLSFKAIGCDTDEKMQALDRRCQYRAVEQLSITHQFGKIKTRDRRANTWCVPNHFMTH